MDLRRHLLLTLRAQGLLRRAPRRSLVDVARRLVALQSQIPSTPLLSLAARVEGIRREDLEREIAERKSLLKVWCFRLTLHVIATEDFPLVHAAVMRDGYERVLSIMRRHDGLTRREIASAERLMLRELGKGPRTRSELARAVPGFRARTFWGREVRCLAQKGLVVHAGRRDGELLFDLRERWAPASSRGRMGVRDARRELLLRYLAAYGSAAPRDFAYWTGLGARDVLPAFGDAREELVERDGLFVRRGEDAMPRATPPERLLPRFDTLVLGHRDKERYLDPRDRAKVFRRAAVVEPCALAGGRVVGTWSYADAQALRPFRKIPGRAARGLRREALRLSPLLS